MPVLDRTSPVSDMEEDGGIHDGPEDLSSLIIEQFADEDLFPARTATASDLVTDQERKLTYYPEQVLLSEIVLQRIRIILKYHHNKTLEDYKHVDFRIFTANNCNLEQQTIERLVEGDSGCIPNSVMKKGEEAVYQYANTRVQKYEKSVLKTEDFRSLLDDVISEKDTLFVIICDEGHWGATRDGAYQSMVNVWNSEQHPNVLPILVTATPYNILTEQTRIPLHAYTLNDDGEPNITEDKAQLEGSEKRLNIVNWTEVLHGLVRQGLVVTLRVPVGGEATSAPQKTSVTAAVDPSSHADKNPQQLQSGNTRAAAEQNCSLPWLTVADAPSGSVLRPLKTTMDEEEAVELLLEGNEKNITIRLLSDPKMILHVINSEHLGFISKEEAVKHSSAISSFDVKFDCGIGLMEWRACSDSLMKPCIEFCKEKNCFLMAPDADKVPSATQHVHRNQVPERVLLWDSYYLHSQGPGKLYINLNYYFNSMKNEKKQDQLIRSDNRFDAMYKQICPARENREQDLDVDGADANEFMNGDLLIAEYALFILLMPLMKASCISESINDLPSLIIQLPHALEDGYTEHAEHVLHQFEEALPENTNDKKISCENFTDVLAHHKNFVRGAVRQSVACGGEGLHEYLWHALWLLNEAELAELSQEIQQNPSFGRLTEQGISFIPDVAKEAAIYTLETARIVNDLNSYDPYMLNGKLTVIRMSTKSAHRFYETICLARQIVADSIDRNDKTGLPQGINFEVLRDASNFKLAKSFYDKNVDMPNTSLYRIKRRLQPSTYCEFRKPHTGRRCTCTKYENSEPDLSCLGCRHPHRVVNTYEKLNGLPCLLIVIQKGRMGDTFPPSFSSMDLRLCRGNAFLSTASQELGRLCRYVNKRDFESLPYALVSGNLIKFLRKGIGMRSTFQSCFRQLDPHVQLVRSDSQNHTYIHPKESHADFENKDAGNQKNRMLLIAEPQIGKTGSYLSLISSLKQAIELDDDDDDDEEEEDFDDAWHSSDEEDEATCLELNEDWLRPKSEHLMKLTFKHTVADGKYARLTGPYAPGKTPTLQPKPNYEVPKRVPSASPEQYKKKQKFAAYTCTHHCELCQRGNDVYEESFTFFGNTEVKISVPVRRNFKPVFDKLRKEADFGDVSSEQPMLDAWIFTPTSGRARISNLNLRHTMVDEEGRPVQHVHFLVVQPQDYESYQHRWRQTHGIIVLPETMPDCENDVSQGGIGYSRLFIQRLATELKLSSIIMMDDNITSVFEAKTKARGKKRVIVREKGDLQMKNVPMWNVLKLFQNLMHPSDDIQCSETGAAKYAIIGTSRVSKYICRVKTPFHRRHCTALTMLNIDLLNKHNISYRPWVVWEDLDLNSQAEMKGLWVLKVNRFKMLKRSVRSWLPKVYVWGEADKLPVVGDCRHVEDELQMMFRYIHKVCSPAHVEELPQHEFQNDTHESKQLHCHVTELRDEKEKHKNWNLLVVHNLEETQVQFDRRLQNHFEHTAGIGRFQQHCLVLPASLCLAMGLTSVHQTQSRLEKIFKVNDAGLFVSTTHKIHVYDVKYVLVTIQGTICNACDRDAVCNISKSERKGLLPDSDLVLEEPVPSMLTEPAITGDHDSTLNKATPFPEIENKPPHTGQPDSPTANLAASENGLETSEPMPHIETSKSEPLPHIETSKSEPLPHIEMETSSDNEKSVKDEIRHGGMTSQPSPDIPGAISDIEERTSSPGGHLPDVGPVNEPASPPVPSKSGIKRLSPSPNLRLKMPKTMPGTSASHADVDKVRVEHIHGSQPVKDTDSTVSSGLHMKDLPSPTAKSISGRGSSTEDENATDGEPDVISIASSPASDRSSPSLISGTLPIGDLGSSGLAGTGGKWGTVTRPASDQSGHDQNTPEVITISSPESEGQSPSLISATRSPYIWPTAGGDGVVGLSNRRRLDEQGHGGGDLDVISVQSSPSPKPHTPTPSLIDDQPAGSGDHASNQRSVAPSAVETEDEVMEVDVPATPPTPEIVYRGQFLCDLDGVFEDSHTQVRIHGTIPVTVYSAGHNRIEVQDDLGNSRLVESHLTSESSKLDVGSRYRISNFLLKKATTGELLILDEKSEVEHIYTPLSSIALLKPGIFKDVRGTVVRFEHPFRWVQDNRWGAAARGKRELREVYIREGTCLMKIALFDKYARMEHKLHSILHIVKAKVIMYNQKKQLIVTNDSIGCRVWSESASHNT